MSSSVSSGFSAAAEVQEHVDALRSCPLSAMPHLLHWNLEKVLRRLETSGKLHSSSKYVLLFWFFRNNCFYLKITMKPQYFHCAFISVLITAGEGLIGDSEKYITSDFEPELLLR